MASKTGRKRGSRNVGYWFRAGRGWYATEGESSVRLLDSNGKPIRQEGALEEAKLAYARYLLGKQEQQPKLQKGETVAEVCEAYLTHVQRKGRASTYSLRHALLFDLCKGYTLKHQKEPPAVKLHRGYGNMPAVDLTPRHIEDWIASHKRWRDGRAAIQAVKRAMNYATKEARTIPANPLRGMKVPSARNRVTYINDEQEAAIYRHGNPAIAQAIRVCIATGARPMCEFARLTAAHVRETDKGQLWVFSPDESKTKKPRKVYVPQEVADEVRKLVKRYPAGPLFRNARGKPWTASTIRKTFSRLKRRLAKHGVQLDKDACVYSTRHSFAKRRLAAGATIEMLAGLMGNTRDICWKHYAQWCEQYTDPLWAALNR